MNSPTKLPSCCREHHEQAVDELATLLANDAATFVSRWAGRGCSAAEAVENTERTYRVILDRLAAAVELGIGWAQITVDEPAT